MKETGNWNFCSDTLCCHVHKQVTHYFIHQKLPFFEEELSVGHILLCGTGQPLLKNFWCFFQGALGRAGFKANSDGPIATWS